MQPVKVATNFSKMRQGVLAVRAHHIVESMTGNADYPDPVPSLDLVAAALADYNDALIQTLNGGKDRTAIKNEKRKVLEALLSKLALYVQANCKESLVILLSSGFTPHRHGSVDNSELDKPSKFKVEAGIVPGSIQLGMDKLERAVAYVFEYTSVPVNETTQWTIRITKGRNYLMLGLTSGKQYAFRAAGIGPRGTALVYSDVITRYVG
jgi:hypothetical protein